MMIRDIEKAYLRSLGKLDQQLVSFALANEWSGGLRRGRHFERNLFGLLFVDYYSQMTHENRPNIKS